MIKQELTSAYKSKTNRQNERAQTAYDIFALMAPYYHIVADAVTLGLHRIWKKKFADTLALSENMKIIDVAGGTGDIAIRVLDVLKKRNIEKNCQVTICDFSPHMLEEGKKRFKSLNYDPDSVEWVEGDAEDLPFEDNSVDTYVISFGIRYCVHPDEVLKEAMRVLKPGKTFFCLELCKPESWMAKCLYKILSICLFPIIFFKVPHVGQFFKDSIEEFPDEKSFTTMIEEIGFQQVTRKRLFCDLAAIHSGLKPK